MRGEPFLIRQRLGEMQARVDEQYRYVAVDLRNQVQQHSSIRAKARYESDALEITPCQHGLQ